MTADDDDGSERIDSFRQILTSETEAFLDGTLRYDPEIPLPSSVLVVHPEPPRCTQYESWLEPFFSVTTASSIDDAVEQVTDGIDIGILSAMFDAEDRAVFLDTLRKHNPYCRFVLLSLDPPTDDYIREGYDRAIVEPAFREELHDVLESLLLLFVYSVLVDELFDLLAAQSERTEARAPCTDSAGQESEDLGVRIDELAELTDRGVNQMSTREYRTSIWNRSPSDY